MEIKRVRFTFEGERVGDPLIYRLGHEFQLVTNIRMTDVEHDFGWVVLEIEGMQSVGVRVDPVGGDVVEG